MSFALSSTETGKPVDDASAGRLRHEPTHQFDMSGYRHRPAIDSFSSQGPSNSCQTGYGTNDIRFTT
jgi:hypothetical protein